MPEVTTHKIDIDEAPASVEVEVEQPSGAKPPKATTTTSPAPAPASAAAFPGPYQGPPVVIHNHPPEYRAEPAHAPTAANNNATRAAIITGAAVVAVALITTFGGWMVNAVAKVQDSVAEVHTLANANLEEQREIARIAEEKTEALRVELAAANQRIDELLARSVGMVPATTPPVVP